MDISSVHNAFSRNAQAAIAGGMNAEAAKSAKEFEAMVIAQLLAPIFDTVKQPGLTNGGPGEDVFGAMLQERYATAIAERGGFGIAAQVKDALIAIQANRNADVSTGIQGQER